MLLLRADGNATIGTGHVMRCLALAQGWQDAGGSGLFAMATGSPELQARVQSEGLEVVRLDARPGGTEDAEQTTALARQAGAAWVVVDGYHFDSLYYRAIRAGGVHLLIVDDYGHADHYAADLVLNQNVYAREDLYTKRESHTRLLLGTRYALLRREFRKRGASGREVPRRASKVLVTLGGSDPNNASLKVVQALHQLDAPDLEARVVVGPANPHLDQLRQTLADAGKQMQLLTHVTDMPALLGWSDLAVAAGGTTCWELCFLAVPSVLLVLADNQRAVADGLAALGAAVSVGDAAELEPTTLSAVLQQLLDDFARRSILAERAGSLVDGFGVERVVAALAHQS